MIDSARPRGPDEMFVSTRAMRRPPLAARCCAVVVVDMVNHQVTRGEGCLRDLEASGVSVDYIDARVQSVVIPAHQRLLAAARETGARVVYLRVGTLAADHADGLPALREGFRSWGAADGTMACEILAPIAPEPGDISIVKPGSGGFIGTGLDALLRNMGIAHVAYTGVVTTGCVLLTVAAGFDLGYHGYLVSDATATFSDRLQSITEELVSGYMAEVICTDDLIARLRASSAD